MFLCNAFKGFRQGAPRIIDIGWMIRAAHASFIWEEPVRFQRDSLPCPSPKSVQRCPSVMDLESRYFVIRCPVDLEIGLKKADGGYCLTNLLGEKGALSPEKFSHFVSLNAPAQWRSEDRPIIQIHTPYRFVADQPVILNQLPPFLDYREAALPGVQICGRMPIHIWPRMLMWAFEWHDPDLPLSLKRGDPWFYLHFETERPDQRIRLSEAAWTEDLAAYCRGLDGVTSYVSNTYSLLKVAKKRRPKTLLRVKPR